jgi:pterin-4a-carbinolamine dehydratase
MTVEHDGERRLERVLRFQDFASALTFANAIGGAAEEQGTIRRCSSRER